MLLALSKGERQSQVFCAKLARLPILLHVALTLLPFPKNRLKEFHLVRTMLFVHKDNRLGELRLLGRLPYV